MMKHIKNILYRFHRQRPLVLLLTLLISGVMVVGSTFSWFTQKDSRTNTFQTKELVFQIKLQEDFTPPGGVNPGQTVEKIVNATNTGDVPGFVRVMVLTDITTQDGTPLDAIPGTTFTYDNLNTTDWADGGDGYYYYLGLLNPGDTTVQPLFTSVTLASNLGPEYDDAIINVQVKVDAVNNQKWNYRVAWWNSANPLTTPPLSSIDNTLKNLVI